MKEQYNKSIERARWFLTEYAEMEKMNPVELEHDREADASLLFFLYNYQL